MHRHRVAAFTLIALALALPANAAGVTGSAIFPAAIGSKYISLKPGTARRKTCLDQYHANKAKNANGGLRWIEKGGGYASACIAKLKK